MQHIRRLTLGQIEDRLGVEGRCLGAQHHGTADTQRHIQLQGEDVEREGGQRQQPRILADTQRAGHAAGEAAQRLVTNHHPFGLASGARGVDHVGQMLRCHGNLGIVLRCAGLLHHQHLHAVRLSQVPQQVRLRQQYPGAAVFKHVGQALCRKLRVERHISATGLEGREQADRHVQGTLHVHRHQHVRADAHVDQTMGQPIGATVEFAVAQVLVIEVQRDGVGLRRGLGLKQLVYAAFAWVVGVAAVPVVHHLLRLRRAEHRQVVQGHRGILQDRAQQVLPMLGQAFHGRRVKQIRGVSQRGPETVHRFLGFQVQVELRAVTGPIHWLQSQAGQLHRG